MRGITVRSRSIVGNLFGGMQTLFGGRRPAGGFERMCAHARESGANAIVGMRYDANDIMDEVTEALAYGTAALVERE